MERRGGGNHWRELPQVSARKDRRKKKGPRHTTVRKIAPRLLSKKSTFIYTYIIHP